MSFLAKKNLSLTLMLYLIRNLQSLPLNSSQFLEDITKKHIRGKKVIRDIAIYDIYPPTPFISNMIQHSQLFHHFMARNILTGLRATL